MDKEICRYGIMSNDKSHIKCKKCDSICVYSRYCTACGKVVMVDNYLDKCKITCSKTCNKKGENKVENINIDNEEIKEFEVRAEVKNETENVGVEEKNIAKEEVKKPKKNKKEKVKKETCDIIKQGKDYIVVKFQEVNFKFNTTKEFKKNKIEVEYTSELGKKDFTIKLK